MSRQLLMDELPTSAALPTTGTGTRAPGWWGMVLFCTTEVTLFACFLVAYFYLRGVSRAAGAEGGEHASLLLPIVLTVLLVSSSISLRWSERAIERGDSRRLAISLAITILLGAGFLGVQVVEYVNKAYSPQTDAYWSLFYTITGFHGAHVALGLLILTFNLVRTLNGHFTAERRLAIQNGALYWHMVDGVWLLIFTALYLAPHFT